MTACSIALEPSRRLAALLAVVHAAALAAALASVPGWPLALIVAGILVSAAASIADALLALPSSVRCVDLEEDGSGRWRDRCGIEHPVRATRASWVSPGLVVLGLRSSRRTRWVILMADSAGAEALRRLRVWLKWRRT